MPYIAVSYPSSTRPYTFFTSEEDIQPGHTVLVKDRKGYSLCTAINYVKKPAFPCSVVIMTQDAMEEEVESEQWEMENEEEDTPNENEDFDFSGENDHA